MLTNETRRDGKRTTTTKRKWGTVPSFYNRGYVWRTTVTVRFDWFLFEHFSLALKNEKKRSGRERKGKRCWKYGLNHKIYVMLDYRHHLVFSEYIFICMNAAVSSLFESSKRESTTPWALMIVRVCYSIEATKWNKAGRCEILTRGKVKARAEKRLSWPFYYSLFCTTSTYVPTRYFIHEDNSSLSSIWVGPKVLSFVD